MRARTSSSLERGELVEVEIAPREADGVLGLAAGEADREELVLVRRGDALARRERPRVADPHAEALDQPVPDRDCAEERDLLRRDRRDQRLERVGLQRRAEAAQPLHDRSRVTGSLAAQP